MGCDPITFHQVDQAVYDRLVNALRDQGGEVTDDTISLTFGGMSVSADYEWVGTDLTITVTRKPMLIPCDAANNELRKIVKGFGGT